MSNRCQELDGMNTMVCMQNLEENGTSDEIICIGKIKSISKNLYLGTTLESGRMYVALTDESRATLWQFRFSMAQQQPYVLPNFGLMESGTQLFMTNIAVDDKIYAVLESFKQTTSFLWKVARSGYNPTDLDNLNLINLGRFYNLEATGGENSKLEIKEPSANDSNQKFQFQIQETICRFSEEGLSCQNV